MKKYTLLSLVLAFALVFAMTGCKSSQTADSSDGTAAEAADSSWTVLESPEGWSLEYPPQLFSVTENEGETNFVYTGDCAGTDMIVMSTHKDKQPEELLYEKVCDFDDSQVQRSEGYFGSNQYWAFTRIVNSEEQGSGLIQQFDAFEYNGGTVLMQILFHTGNDENQNMEVSDTFEGVVNTLLLKDLQPSVLFANTPGTYTRTYEEEIEGQKTTVTEKIILNEDHSGTVSFQDDVPITWTSIELITEDNQSSEYTIEGDMLYYKNGDSADAEWLEFQREAK